VIIAINKVLIINPISISEAAIMLEITPIEVISPNPVVVNVVIL
jgi:hypothetical protein